MTTTELFQGIVDQIILANKEKQAHPNKTIRFAGVFSGFYDIFEVFYIEKHIRPVERYAIYKDMLHSLFDFLVLERDAFWSKNKNLTIDSNDLSKETSHISNYLYFFDFLISKTAPQMDEGEFVKFVDFSCSKKIISYHNTYSNKVIDYDISETFFSVIQLLNTLRAYQEANIFSHSFLKNVEQKIRDSKTIQDYVEKTLSKILNNEPFTDEVESKEKFYTPKICWRTKNGNGCRNMTCHSLITKPSFVKLLKTYPELIIMINFWLMN